MTVYDKQEQIPLKKLARAALHVGLTGYGGPAILAHMKKVFVEEEKWLDEQVFLNGLSLSQMLPGATGVNMITFLGYQTAGGRGALVASLFFTAPGFVLMMILSAAYFAFGRLPVVQSLFVGLGAVVVALLVNATVILGRSAIKDPEALGIAMLSFAGVQVLHLHILLVVILAALTGFAIYGNKIRRQNAVTDTPRPSAPKTNTSRRIEWLVVGAFVGAAVLLELIRGSLAANLVSSMFRIGVTAFGGGFTSVPLFQHETVALHHWLTPRQFIDGIALGQITPGPVIITATFIGYRLLGVPGAFLATLAIYSPTVLLMLLAARQYERYADAAWAKAMIRGILAGFIGILSTVILRLGSHSLTDWKTVALFLTAAAVLLIAKKNPLWVILGGAAVSLLLF